LSASDEGALRGGEKAAHWLAAGRQCLQERDFETAETRLRQALALQPDLSEAFELLGKLLYRDGRAGEAAALYLAWQQAVPAHPVAAHLVAATGGAPPPDRASDDFITLLYQRAAAQFDATTDALGYRAPQLLCDCLAALLGPDWRCDRVLDLGCGTGLCGALLRSHVAELVGVDLSPHMLDQARRRACYDRLECAELTDFLKSCRVRFEVVTAADVFCYFGELAPVFTAIGAVLRPQGRFVFSVEALEDPRAGPHVRLQEHGRYAHGRDFLQQALGQAGLMIETAVQDMLRFERGLPVQGWIVTALAV
jgi:predicted TPR repeat methyltransferase